MALKKHTSNSTMRSHLIHFSGYFPLTCQTNASYIAQSIIISVRTNIRFYYNLFFIFQNVAAQSFPLTRYCEYRYLSQASFFH